MAGQTMLPKTVNQNKHHGYIGVQYSLEILPTSEKSPRMRVDAANMLIYNTYLVGYHSLTAWCRQTSYHRDSGCSLYIYTKYAAEGNDSLWLTHVAFFAKHRRHT